MKLPLLLSVPHAGLRVPEEVAPLCALSPDEIARDGDEGAAEVFALARDVEALVTTDVARAIVDVNRSEVDRRPNGVVRTHTCWEAEIYRRFPSEELIARLLDAHYHPYHAQLTRAAASPRVLLGVDGHTMADTGPPISPDPGAARPAVCLANGSGSCPREWLESLAECFERAFGRPVSLNKPFRGGFIIRSHAREIPWVQLSLSRAPFATVHAKRAAVLSALEEWCSGHGSR